MSCDKELVVTLRINVKAPNTATAELAFRKILQRANVDEPWFEVVSISARPKPPRLL